jgi:uroporphyrinogen-III synthase
VVAIGPTTAQALAERGIPVAQVAQAPTAVGLLEASVLALRG